MYASACASLFPTPNPPTYTPHLHTHSFHAAGAVVGALLLTLICLGTDATLFFLISSARRTGAKSYEVCGKGLQRQQPWVIDWFLTRVFVYHTVNERT